MTSLRRYRWLLLALGVAALATAVLAISHSYRASEVRELATRPRGRRWLALGALAVALLAVGVVGGAYAYDASRGEVIAAGVRVGHVELGGLTAAQARRALERGYARLNRPIVTRSGDEAFWLSAGQLGVEVHLDEAVSHALERSRSESFLTRTVRDITGWDVDLKVAPRVTYSGDALAGFAEHVERTVERPPLPARVVPRGPGLDIREGEDGLDVDSARLRGRIERALTDVAVPRRFTAPVRRTRPEVAIADLRRLYPTYMTVDRAGFKLRLYEHLKLARTYPIAVGAIGYDTPAGLYKIQNKAVNPSWTVPYSAWTGSLAGAVIPPGPSNPLKARWLGIYGGAGIHGTDSTWSLGSAASHGCIRMAIDDVVELYDRVDVGTPIYIG